MKSNLYITFMQSLFTTIFALLLAFCSLHGRAQNTVQTPLISGPMLGYAEHREVLIWLEVSPGVQRVELRYWAQGQPQTARTAAYQGALQQPYNPLRIAIGGLALGTTYEYEVWLDGKHQNLPYPLRFATKDLWEWRKPAPNFSFQMGSCLYVNDSIYDRPGKPYGAGFAVTNDMTRRPADFVLWLGDNTYLREADWSSGYGIQYRYQHTRRQPELQALWAARPHYATWDDHDYGPNNGNLSYNGKEIALQTFKNYWGNQQYGESDNAGVYSYFSWSDADFFLLDNRYHRSAEDLPATSSDKTYLGKRQMDWLKNALLASKATFKFVASGSQVTNEANKYECMRQYQREFDDLLGFIAQQHIEGVVFLSGDRHFSEILRYAPTGSYPIYEITASPLSSGAFKNIATDKKEGNNPQRVTDALCNTQNYLQISIDGEPKQRRLSATCYDGTGKAIFTHTINANDLR